MGKNGCFAAGKNIIPDGMTPRERDYDKPPMGLDPGVVFFLKPPGLSNKDIDTALNKQSGLGVWENMRTVPWLNPGPAPSIGYVVIEKKHRFFATRGC
ncbi:MAG: hypothetical protein H0A75_03950 [Candidatus Methanofishera endochildressiae]|uniref:Uncharacterized protein n=1 Tax=Candidatus Methanofishera endochildressiae TaxID=2738884 RepID=A0A7Z0MNM8_9GAMM|nr:hypothetical protein [Candidatus Methanofishera endochildressiae]